MDIQPLCMVSEHQQLHSHNPTSQICWGWNTAASQSQDSAFCWLPSSKNIVLHPLHLCLPGPLSSSLCNVPPPPPRQIHPHSNLLLIDPSPHPPPRPPRPAGGLISAIFDETFGILLYAAGRWGHFDLSMVFTARLEVDYKKVGVWNMSCIQPILFCGAVQARIVRLPLMQRVTYLWAGGVSGMVYGLVAWVVPCIEVRETWRVCCLLVIHRVKLSG